MFNPKKYVFLDFFVKWVMTIKKRFSKILKIPLCRENHELHVKSPKTFRSRYSRQKKNPQAHGIFSISFRALLLPEFCTSEQENFGEDVEGKEDQ